MNHEYAYTSGTGENYLALDGLELDIPINACLEEQFYILWDDHPEQELNGLRRFRTQHPYS